MLPLQGRGDLGAIAIKGYSVFPKAPALHVPHHRIILYHIQDICWRVLPLCRDVFGVFYSPSRLGRRTLVGDVLPPCWDAVGVFYSPRQLGHRILVVGVLPSAEMQSVYSSATANWDTEQSLGKSYPSAKMQLVYSAAPPDGARYKWSILNPTDIFTL